MFFESQCSLKLHSYMSPVYFCTPCDSLLCCTRSFLLHTIYTPCVSRKKCRQFIFKFNSRVSRLILCVNFSPLGQKKEGTLVIVENALTAFFLDIVYTCNYARLSVIVSPSNLKEHTADVLIPHERVIIPVTHSVQSVPKAIK